MRKTTQRTFLSLSIMTQSSCPRFTRGVCALHPARVIHRPRVRTDASASDANASPGVEVEDGEDSEGTQPL